MNVDPVVVPAHELVTIARLAEDSGFDLIGVQDHPYSAHFYDTWTLIAYLAAKTRSIAFTPVETERLTALIDGLMTNGVIQPDRMTPDLMRVVLDAHLDSLAKV